MVGGSSDLRQELEADYRTFRLTGDHYAIGYQMGQVTTLRPVQSWRDRETELAFARACADVVSRFHPSLVDEFRGYAAGQGCAWEDVLSHFSNNLPEGTLGGCTTIALRLLDGHMLVARNHDFLYARKERYLRQLSPVGYPASLGAQSGYVGSCYDGVNGYGLFVALHTVRAQRAEGVAPGVPPYLIPRILLETCHSAQEAVSRLRQMSHLYPFNYLIADEGDIFAVETYPGRVHVRRPAEDCLIVTNYYESPTLRPLQGRRDLTEYTGRVRWLEERIVNDHVGAAIDAWSWAQHLLRDHTLPMCHHHPNQATLWSLVADLTARRVAYCLGAPCRNEFREWDWPENE